MKVEVVERFYDELEKKIREVGDEFDCTEERCKEIIDKSIEIYKKPFVKLKESPKPKKSKKVKKENDGDKE